MRPGKVAGGSSSCPNAAGVIRWPQPQYNDTTPMCLTSEGRGPIKSPVFRVSVSLYLQPQMVTGDDQKVLYKKGTVFHPSSLGGLTTALSPEMEDGETLP